MGRRPRNPRIRTTRTVTLQIVRVAYDHDLSADEGKEARRLRRGDVVDVMLTPPNATRTGNDWHWDRPIGSERFGLIHMRDVPEDRWQHMRRRFTEELAHDNTGMAEAQEPKHTVRRRRWRFDIPGMAEQKRDTFLADKEVTYAWDAARQLIKKKHYNDLLDPSRDDYTPVEDSDLPAT